MLKHMIQLNMRITNKHSSLAPGLFGLRQADHQFGAVAQPMGCASNEAAISLPL
jgi:hypothetical protein